MIRETLVVTLVLGAGLPGASAQTPDTTIAAAQRGGTVIVCRHAITSPRPDDADVVDYNDPRTQRLLSEEGERQAEAMGRAFRELRIPIADVVASPMQRARRTAELMFGRATIDSLWHTNDGKYHDHRRDLRRSVVSTTPAKGNLLVVSHIVTITSAVPEANGELEEGDCIVLRPGGEGYAVVGVVPWRRWLERAGIRSRVEDGRAALDRFQPP